MEETMETFTNAYIEAALWAEMDNANEQGGEPLDANYSPDDIAPETLERMKADCAKFLGDAKIVAAINSAGDMSHAGHDFWLTRRGHGAGFWDGDWQQPEADILDSRASGFGDFELYVGDDEKIYHT